MKKCILLAGLLMTVIMFQAVAQEDEKKVVISGDLTTIYTIGNASDEQKIDDPNAAGAYFNSQTDPAKKNGFYTAANLYATLRPTSWLEGYFKLYSIHRPGSFHLPTQMENMGKEDFAAVKLDSVYGKVEVFQALDLELPLDLSLKAGKYKAQASQYGVVSKYKTEQVLYMLNTKNDFTYELGLGFNGLTLTGSTNYLFNEAIQRYYDEDGAVDHGNVVLNEYAPAFLIGIRLADIKQLAPDFKDQVNVELLYGQNVSGIYSGNSIGFSGRYILGLNDSLSIPIGLGFGYYEKNIDLLGQAAIATASAAAGGTNTMDFRDSLAAGLGVGVRYRSEGIDLDANLGGTFSSVKHYYRTDLSIIDLSLDLLATFQKRYFIGGGLILGTLMDVEWKTRDDVSKEDYYHNFTLAENMGYEIYAGLSFMNSGKFVIGFNQNKGLSLNHMLEARADGQMKYKQVDTNWATDKLAEAGGLYFKFAFTF